ncbi:hypothetical protein AB0D40_41340 [Streptomyces massasporeus]|uniref:hypothetical protein n=1 Tax=Streptomyces massasporeus TaxID=67324 RepID=UPI0033EDAE16
MTDPPDHPPAPTEGPPCAPLSDDVQDQIVSTMTLSGGQTLEETTVPITNRYETTSD